MAVHEDAGYRCTRSAASLGAWIEGVNDFFMSNNKRFPDRLPFAEVRASAYSVSTWVWSEFNEITPSKGKGPLDHSSIAQSWRGTWSGASRRRGTPLENDRRPWESMGISRATWYRRVR